MPVWNKPNNRFHHNNHHNNYNNRFNNSNSINPNCNNSSNNTNGPSPPPFHRRHSSGSNNYHRSNNTNRPYNRFYNNSNNNSSGSNHNGGVSSIGGGGGGNYHSPNERGEHRSERGVSGSGNLNHNSSMNNNDASISNNASVNNHNNHNIHSSTGNDNPISRHYGSVEEGEIDTGTINSTSGSSSVTGSNNNDRTISFKPPSSSSLTSTIGSMNSKFIPAPSSNSVSNVGNNHEEGEIQPSTNVTTTAPGGSTCNSKSHHSNRNLFNKVPTWTPPPGASSNNNTMNNSTMGGERVMNNNDNHGNNDSNNNTPKKWKGTSNNSNWRDYDYNNNNNNYNNSNQHHNQKWDKPTNYLKKRFTSDSITTGTFNDSCTGNTVTNNNIDSNNNGERGERLTYRERSERPTFHRLSSSMPLTSTSSSSSSLPFTLSSWKRSSVLGSVGNGSGSGSNIESKEGGGSGEDYYGPNNDNSNNTTNLSSSSSNLEKDDGIIHNSNTRDQFSPSIRKKTFQPPIGKEKKNFYSSPPQSHSNQTSSNNINSAPSSSPMPRMVFSSSNNDTDNNNVSDIKKEWESKQHIARRQSFKGPLSTSLSSSLSEKFIKRSFSLDTNINDNYRNKVLNDKWKPASVLTNNSSTPATITSTVSSEASPTFKNEKKSLNGSSSNMAYPPSVLSTSERSSSLRIVSDDSILSLSTKTDEPNLTAPSMTATTSASVEGGSTQISETSSTPTTSSSSTILLPPIKLSCSALGSNDDINKGRKLMRELSTLLSDGLLDNNIDAMILPSTDQIHSGIKTLESQIEERKLECRKIRVKLQRAEKKREQEEKEKEKQEMAEAAASKRDTEVENDNLDEKVDDDGDLVMNDQFEDETAELEKEKDAEELRLKEEMQTIKLNTTKIENEIEILLLELKEEIKMENERMLLEAENAKQRSENEKLIESAEAFLNETKQALESSAKLTEESAKRLDFAKVPLSDFANELNSSTEVSEVIPSAICRSDTTEEMILPDSISPRLHRVLAMTRDNPGDMSNLISSIYKQNRQIAEAAHEKALSLLPSPGTNYTNMVPPPMLLAEPPLDISDDTALRQYLESWSNLAREVTGPGDALYTEPNETPLYESTKDKHESMKLLIKEHIKSKKRNLHKRWIELAEEYSVRQEKYSKETNITSSSFTSADTANSSILSGGEYSPEASSGRGGNPYRRARRGVMSGMGGGDVVRSEYEQEQIIAQLEAKANMEKRIKQGGSKLPRQQCQLEKVRFCFCV